jgi:ATP-binding cassette subfamily C (CFTR/MRP) protein 1
LAVLTGFIWSKLSFASFALGLFGSLAVVILEIYEHPRTIAPSTPILLYLSALIIQECVKIWILWSLPEGLGLLSFPFIILGFNIALLVLESWPKTAHLKQKEQYSPEELTGFYGRVLFWWINPLLLQGSRSTLQEKDIYSLEHVLQAKVVQHEAAVSWEKSEFKVLSWTFVDLQPNR